MSSSVAAVQASCVALCGGKPKEPSLGGKKESSVVVTREDEDVLGPLPGATEASAKPNSVKRVQTLSGGADLSTIPDDLQEALSEFDIDGGGVLRVDDIVQAAKLYRDSQDVRKKLYKLLLGLGVFVFILLGAITGLTAAMVELSKDTKPDASGVAVLKGTKTMVRVENPGLKINGSSMLDPEGVVVATADLTSAEAGGQSMTTQDGRLIKTDKASYANDVSNSGLWSLFDSPQDNIQAMTELQITTPEQQQVVLKIDTYLYREVFLKQFRNGTLIVPPELINGANATTYYDMVWNILLFKTLNKRYPMVRVTQTTYFDRNAETVAASAGVNYSDPNANFTVTPLLKYNVTTLLNATESAEYENFANKPLAEMIAETSNINGTISYNASVLGGAVRRRDTRRRRRRRQLLGLLDYEEWEEREELGRSEAAATTRDLLYDAVPHFNHEHDEEVEQYLIEDLIPHAPADVHTGRRRLLVSRVLHGSLARQAGEAFGNYLANNLKNYLGGKIDGLIMFTQRKLKKILDKFDISNKVKTFLSQIGKPLTTPLNDMDKNFKDMRGLTASFRKDLASLPDAIKRMMKRELEPVWGGVLNPCDGVIQPTLTGFNTLLRDNELKLQPWCPQAAGDTDASRCLVHLNRPGGDVHSMGRGVNENMC